MKTLAQIFLLLLMTPLLWAQTTHHCSLGASYSNGEYYNLSTDATTVLSHASWDIAFSVYGATDAAIFINEGASYSSTAPQLYPILNKNFGDNIQQTDLGAALKNDEKSWSDGAFNSTKVLSNWADYGWGVYNMSNHKIEGNTLYAIELSNGTFKKIMIDSLKGGTYYFRYADFDGNNLQSKTISKSAYPNQTLAYFSFTTNNALSAEPTTGWDWLFTRYETFVDNAGTPMPYGVGGILLNRGVEAVLAEGINPSTVDENNYTTSSDSLTIIGHTWKNYDFTNGWTTAADRVYFIKTTDSSLYKIQFVDFQGSSTGQATFLKTYIGKWTSIEKTKNTAALEAFDVYPNPATALLNLTYSLEHVQENLQVQLVDMLGRVLLQKNMVGQKGLNALELLVDHLEAGNYILSLQSDKVFISKQIQIK